MNKKEIFIFVPINIGRNLQSLLKRKAPNMNFITPTSSREELKYFEETFTKPEDGNLPELIVTLHPEILKYFQKEEINKYYIKEIPDIPPYRKDLTKIGLELKKPFCTPLLYAPVIFLINKDIKNKPSSWTDLLRPEFYGKVMLPDALTPISIIFKETMRQIDSSSKTESFLQSVKYTGLPFDVISGVNKGFYDIGILPLPFARYNVGKNLETVIPKEGPIMIPEMLFLHKNASEETKTVVTDLFGKNIQRFFSQLGALIPVIEEIPLPVEMKNLNEIMDKTK